MNASAMKINSLSFKIIIRILFFTILLGGVIFTTYYLFTRGQIEKAARDKAFYLAENTKQKIEEIIRPAELIPQNLAWMMESGAIPKDSIYSFLEKLVRQNPIIYASAIAFEPDAYAPGVKAYAPYAYRAGENIESTDLWSSSYNYFIWDWYQIPALLKEPYWSEPYYDEGGGAALMSTYSVPFYVQRNGERLFGGIITIDISLEWLTDIMNSVKIFDKGYSFLISRFGVYVAHPEHKYIMNHTIFTRAKELDMPDLRDIGRDMIHGVSDLKSTTLEELGRVSIYHTQLSSTKWSLGVVYPHREMYAGLYSMNLIIILLSLGGLGILLFFTIRIIQRLLSPLTLFAGSAREVASGNFQAKLPAVQGSLEMKELHDSFAYMQKALADYVVDLKETTTAKEKIESELRIAKEIQMGMIPHIFPPFPDLPEIDLYASLLSAKEVGGDLYDFFLLDEKTLCFAIGDVSGKGIPASLFMAVTRTLLRSVANRSLAANEIVGAVNKTLSHNNESNMFVTFFLGILDIQSGELSYCNAGHNPPVLVRAAGEQHFFNLTKAIPLGLFDSHGYVCERIQLERGDRIFLYTDGVTEAEDSDNKLFGDDSLLLAIREHPQASPRELIDYVNNAVAKHVNGNVQSDDLTMMCISYYGNHKQ